MKQPFFLVAVLALLSSCYVFKAYRFRNFDLKDLHKIEAVPLPSSPKPFAFAYDTLRVEGLKKSLNEALNNSQTYAFLVIRNDSILYERYFGDVNDSTMLPSFSMAKSVTGTLLGIALHEGYIKSLQEPVTNYLPQLRKKDKRFEAVTLQHVLDMRSGVRSNESYTNPFSDVLRMGFARNVSKPVLKMKTGKAPGEFDYKSANTQLLALVIEKATGRKLQEYAAEKLWTPLQMEFPATWNDDKAKTVRAFCCINAAARDFAKFGRLFLHNGAWQGQQIVPEEWVRRSTAVDSMSKYDGYKNQWWARKRNRSDNDSMRIVTYLERLRTKGRIVARESSGVKQFAVAYYDGAYYAAGLLGQYIYINPLKNLLIVRLGHDWMHPRTSAIGFIYDLGDRL